MSKTSLFIPNRLKSWIDARQRFRLSHAHVQMAFELGLNPKKFGKLANHRQEPWKLPLPDFIAKLYFKRFGKTMPDPVRTIEQMAAAVAKKKQAKKLRKTAARFGPSEHGAEVAPILAPADCRDEGGMRSSDFTEKTINSQTPKPLAHTTAARPRR